MLKANRHLLLITILLLGMLAKAQEGVVLFPLLENSSLENAKEAKKSSSDLVLTLPFFEDFSQLSPLPDPNKWTDNQVFINNSYPLFPPSFGVATFDGLDAQGKVYSQASTQSFPADTLSSLPIRMDSNFVSTAKEMQVKDSIYFSFYYQPGGGYGNEFGSTKRGQRPNKNDRLILEFLRADQSWKEVWSTAGSSLSDFCPECVDDSTSDIKYFFKQVMIPLTDSANYFHAGFRFRFRNLASINQLWGSSNSQWHIDYIRLATGRSIQDTLATDIAFVEWQSSLLKNYQSMPAKQFLASELVDHIEFLASNLSPTADLVNYHYFIKHSESNEVLYKYPEGDDIYVNATLFPYATHAYSSSPYLFRQNFDYDFADLATKSGTYEFTQVIKMGQAGDISLTNDSLRFFQEIGPYFAYDDGSAEGGIGVNYKEGMMALKYSLHQADTLTAVQFMFNHTKGESNEVDFTLCVWSEKDGLPDQLLCRQEAKVNYEDAVNGLHTYVLDQAMVLPATSFFIGFQQYTDISLNLGFDHNNNANQHFYYFDYASYPPQWRNVLYYGAPMMRAVFDPSIETTVLHPENELQDPDKTVLFPNPASEVIQIRSDAEFIKELVIYTVTGKILHRSSHNEQHVNISISELPAGIFLVNIETTGGRTVKKLIKN